MGKGDKKSKRGKIILGSFGVRRPRKKAYVHVTDVTEPLRTHKLKESKAVKEVNLMTEAAPHKETKAAKEKKEPKKEVKEAKHEATAKAKKAKEQ